MNCNESRSLQHTIERRVTDHDVLEIQKDQYAAESVRGYPEVKVECARDLAWIRVRKGQVITSANTGVLDRACPPDGLHQRSKRNARATQALPARAAGTAAACVRAPLNWSTGT